MFVHWHRHSEYSRLDGIGTAKEYAARAAELGQPGLALTDHGTMSGALHHIHACWNKDDKGKSVREGEPIVPIMGVEAYFKPDRKPRGPEWRENFHLCLFAKNMTGWHNLLRIVTHSNRDNREGEGFEQGGFYDNPCVDWELLEAYHEGLIASSACISSYMSRLIQRGDSQGARDYVTRMLNLFGDDFWMEIMPHDFDDQRTLNKEVYSLAQDFSVPVIATNDAHFPVKEMAETQRAAKIMGHGSCMTQVAKDLEEGKASYLDELTPTLYIAHEEEMRLWFQKNHPALPESFVDEACDNTFEMFKRVKPFMLDKSLKLPKITENASESEATLREWIEDGLKNIVGSYQESHFERWPYQTYVDRVEYEMEILKSKGVIDYFVMLGEVVRWAKSTNPLPEVGASGELYYPSGKYKRPIRVGLGRGSAAGCLVSYLVGITAVDPISYGLLFERFLNPARKGMPDIDMDFDSERRDEVKEYLSRRFGRDHVADIITHSTFQPKKVIQDVCRVFDDRITFLEAKSITDTIEIRQDSEETTLEELLPLNEKLQWLKEAHPDIWKVALDLEGGVANAGKHAAGIIITPKPVREYMALERGKKGDLVTSWSDAADFQAISDNGFLKYDFLGIEGLTKHEYACKLIEQDPANEANADGGRVDLNALPALRDPYAVEEAVMEAFSDGYTVGVFQFGSRGITNLIKEIKPENILELAAANALYRPGPMKGGVTWDYAKRKHNAFLRTYWHETVKPVLEETFGVIAFQEQVMEISKVVGDFTGAEADDMRKAMGKLYRIKGGSAAKDFMGRFEKKWFENAEKNGLDRKTADEIWHKLLEFGHYGFNKSHSASYALQAYQDMWLKVNYPAEFYAAFLTYEDDEKKRQAALREAKSRGIEIVMPDVNKSGVGYTVDWEGNLLLGLTAISGIGTSNAQDILALRPFSTIDDLFTRGATKVPLRELIESGAVDSLGADRGYLLSAVQKVGSKEYSEWQVWEHLKHNTKLKKPRDVPAERREPSEKQLEALKGARLNLPLASLNLDPVFQRFMEDNVVDDFDAVLKGQEVVVGGEITKVTKKKTKKGKPFANVNVVFGANEWTVKFWERELLACEDCLEEGRIVMVNGKKDEWNGFVSVVCNMAAPIEEAIDEATYAELAAEIGESVGSST